MVYRSHSTAIFTELHSQEGSVYFIYLFIWKIHTFIHSTTKTLDNKQVQYEN